MLKIILCSTLLLIFVLVRCQDIDLEFSDNLEKKKHGGCNDTLLSNTGSIYISKNSTLPDHECVWVIQPNITNQTHGAIGLFFQSLILHEDDTIQLYKTEDDAKNETNPILHTALRADNGSITIITDEKSLVVKLKGTNTNFNRVFAAEYDSKPTISFQIPPDVTTMYSPVHSNKTAAHIHCEYLLLKDAHSPTISSFIFEQYNFSTSTVTFSGSSHDGKYLKDLLMDIFAVENPMKIEVEMDLSKNETYRLKKHEVDARCSFHKIIGEHDSENFVSPPEVLNNGSIVTECRWIFEHRDPTKVLSVNFDNLKFDSALDIVAINNGASELSPPLLQVTTSNRNYTMNQLIRSHGPYVWIAFKAMTFGSKVSGRVTEQGEGGYFKGNGKITAVPTGNNQTVVVYLLEVESDQIVYLNFTATSLASSASLSIYDGFDKSNLLATLRGDIWYPVLSQTSKMMIMASGFAASSFTAEFKGVQPGCLHMSTMSNENYILSGNCNATCLWVIPPQDRSGSELLLNLQYLSLLEGDTIDITRLDANRTKVGSTIDANVTHIPQLVIPSNVGAIMEINRASCAKDKGDIVLVGHSSYVPACGKNLSVDDMGKFQISSPLYPDTYPIFASCLWKISTPKENTVHLAFNAFSLAPNHCIKVQSSDNTTQQYSGSELPEDLFLKGESLVQFDSSNCGKPAVAATLQSSRGFVVNGTVSSCGGVFSMSSGEFSVPVNKTFCIWKVSVPETDSNANDNVNIISYTVSKKDEAGNYELKVYDGSSIREPVIKNESTSATWSRTNNLIFVYKRIDATKISSILSVKYSAMSCNATNQCDNKICLHPDWRCNGENDCGDFSDERNCASVPVPPPVLAGYSSLAFWLTLFIMLATGVFLGVTVPYCYQRYKNGQYRRFGDFSVVQ